MAYERNTTEGIRTWLEAETSTPGWNSSSIAKGLTEDVMALIVDHYAHFDSKIRQGILLSTMYMRKGDLMIFRDELNKVMKMALNDSDDFVKTTAHVLRDYPSNQQIDLNIDLWSHDFRLLLSNIGLSIKQHGFNFHPLEDMILQSSARTTPPHVSATYSQCKSTHTQHFKLTDNQDNIISSEARYKLFESLVKSEKELDKAEQKAADAVAQKRAAGHDLQSGRAKRANSTTTSPTSTMSNPFPFPLASQQQAQNVPIARPGMPVVRQNSVGSVPGASSLFTKRPARPTAAAGGGGGLFINSKKPVQRSGMPARPINGGAAGQRPPTNVPRGFQKVQKTQMLDFNAANEIEQNAANEVKRVQDDEKAKKEAIKQEALEKKQKLAAEKKEREEQKRAQRLAAQEAKAQRLRERAEAEARERAIAEQEARDRALEAAREQAETEQRERLDEEQVETEAQQRAEAEVEVKYEAQQEQQVSSHSSSSSSRPASSTSPKMSIKSEHVFAVPAIPAQHQQQHNSQQQFNQPQYSQPQSQLHYNQPQFGQQQTDQFDQQQYSQPQYGQQQNGQPHYDQQPHYGQPQYSQQQYSQPQPQYSLPQYGQPQQQYGQPQQQYGQPQYGQQPQNGQQVYGQHQFGQQQNGQQQNGQQPNGQQQNGRRHQGGRSNPSGKLTTF